MPFYSGAKPVAEMGLKYAPTMPSALLVAVLDGDIEREGRTTAVLYESFVYEDEIEGLRFRVPQSYITDFASIPWLVRGLIPAFGRHAKAAVVHDWLYAVGEPDMRARADRVFLHALRELKVAWFKRLILYTAVRLGGGGGYNKERRIWNRTFADWRDGKRLEIAPFERHTAFTGETNGPQPL